MTHDDSTGFVESVRLCLQITKRNWAVYRKDLIANISPSVADPAFIMVSLGLGLGGFVSDLSGRSYLQFLAPGLCVATTLMTSFFETSYGFYVRMTFENVYKAMLTTPIGPLHIVLGELIWVGLKGAIMALGVALVTAAFGLMPHLGNLWLVVYMGFIVGVSCGSIGLIASGLIRNINQIQTVYSFLISPLFFLSGIFFPLSSMPALLLLAVDLFPLSHGVRMVQAAYWDENVFEVVVKSSLAILAQAAVYGSAAYYLIRKKLLS
jgi:lipooligosaccharide transport system permease protein